MPDWTLVNRSHVLAAMEEHDRLDGKEFLRRYGFRRSKYYTLWHAGQEYDPTAVLGVAYVHATGRPATSDELSGGEEGAAKVLKDLGFDVVALEVPVAPSRTRRPSTTTSPRPRKTAPAPARKRVAKPEPAVKLCPTCNVAVPASGVCDFCD